MPYASFMNKAEKILSERKEKEHYASNEYLKSKNPNFHLPQYFAEAVITAGNKKKI